MKEIEKLLKKQREICAEQEYFVSSNIGTATFNEDMKEAIHNAPSPVIDEGKLIEKAGSWRKVVLDGLVNGRFGDLKEALSWVDTDIVFPAYHIADYYKQRAIDLSGVTKEKESKPALQILKEVRKESFPNLGAGEYNLPLILKAMHRFVDTRQSGQQAPEPIEEKKECEIGICWAEAVTNINGINVCGFHANHRSHD
jgi:hypothetical protein